MSGPSKRKRDNREHVLVYSTDPIPAKAPPAPHLPTAPYQLKPAVRIERNGRGGKSVTVLYKLPVHETLLQALAAHLKKTLGTGGTSYTKNGEGLVEIQGEHRETILQLVAKFKWKPG